MSGQTALLDKKRACMALFGSANSNRYKQLKALAAAGEIKLIDGKWVPRAEILRLAGDLDG